MIEFVKLWNLDKVTEHKINDRREIDVNIRKTFNQFISNRQM